MEHLITLLLLWRTSPDTLAPSILNHLVELNRETILVSLTLTIATTPNHSQLQLELQLVKESKNYDEL